MTITEVLEVAGVAIVGEIRLSLTPGDIPVVSAVPVPAHVLVPAPVAVEPVVP